MRVTIESVVSDDATIAEFWGMYQTAFAPLATLAATKQTMSEAEFRGLMVEESVLKFVGWDRNGDPAAMMVLATDLAHVSWINPEFFANRFPEQAARGAIYYTMAALVRPTARGSLWYRAVLHEVVKFSARNLAVTCLDCCYHNVVNVQIPRIAQVLSASVAEVESHEIDTQTFFAVEFHAVKDHLNPLRAIDLTSGAKPGASADIDLSEAPEPARPGATR